MIHATWIDGGRRVTGGGLVARSACGLCRKLIAVGYDPATPMEVRWPDGRESLTFRSIGAGAKLTVRDGPNGSPVFARWKPPPHQRQCGGFGSPMRQTHAAGPTRPDPGGGAPVSETLARALGATPRTGG